LCFDVITDEEIFSKILQRNTTEEKVCGNNGKKIKTKPTSFLLSASADRMRGLTRVVGDVWALLLCGLMLPSSGFSRGPTLLPYAAMTNREK